MSKSYWLTGLWGSSCAHSPIHTPMVFCIARWLLCQTLFLNCSLWQCLIEDTQIIKWNFSQHAENKDGRMLFLTRTWTWGVKLCANFKKRRKKLINDETQAHPYYWGPKWMQDLFWLDFYDRPQRLMVGSDLWVGLSDRSLKPAVSFLISNSTLSSFLNLWASSFPLSYARHNFPSTALMFLSSTLSLCPFF